MSEDSGGTGGSLGAFRSPQQGDERAWVELQDQWGRRWGCLWDFGRNAQAPVSVLQPLGGWVDRLNTPPMYMRFTKLNNMRFTIDVDAWINDRIQANEDYRQRLNEMAIGMSPADGGAALLGDDPDGERGPSSISSALFRRVGPAPLSPTPIRALKAGNKFVLGLTDKMPSWAAPYFVKKTETIVEFPDVEDEVDEVTQDEHGVIQTPVGHFPDAEEEEEEESPPPSVLAGLGAIPRAPGGKFAKRDTR